jgi:hypothetical protein
MEATVTGALVTLGGITILFAIVVLLDWLAGRQEQRSHK